MERCFKIGSFLMILSKTILVRKGVKRKKNEVNADYRNGYYVSYQQLPCLIWKWVRNLLIDYYCDDTTIMLT